MTMPPTQTLATKMLATKGYYSHLDALKSTLLKYVISSGVPAHWFYPGCKHINQLENTYPQAKVQHLELVIHCWQYAHLLQYQLQSIVENPPSQAYLTVTVFYSAEDEKTLALLQSYQQKEAAGIHWNCQELPKTYLFRRAIGRNIAALNTKADWIWFTDCDLIFGEGSFDSLIHSIAKTETNIKPKTPFNLGYPAFEHRSLPAPFESLAATSCSLAATLDKLTFIQTPIAKATGPLQITRGDAARMLGYCRDIRFYQKPAKHWCKALEDRAFRWLLASDGHALNIVNIKRIQHIEKGRYKHSDGIHAQLRKLGQRLKNHFWQNAHR